MSERLTNLELRDLLDTYCSPGTAGSACYVPTQMLRALLEELRDRRADDANPAPIEEATLRDEIAMRAMAAMIAVTAPTIIEIMLSRGDVGDETEALKQRNRDWITGHAYRMADAMLAQRARAKETKKP